MSSFHFIRTLVVGIAALSSTLVGYAQNIDELSLSKQVLLADLTSSTTPTPCW